MNMKSLIIVLMILFLSAGVFAASGYTADGNVRVELVYITEIGHNNVPIDDRNIIDYASDDLTTGTFQTPDGNIVIVGVFFTEFEQIINQIIITFINPFCLLNNKTNAVRFNVVSDNNDPILDINYRLNGIPSGPNLNVFCTGPDANKTCTFQDPNMVPFSTNTIFVSAENKFKVQIATCDFNYNPDAASIMFIQKTDWVTLLIILGVIIGIGALLFFYIKRQ